MAEPTLETLNRRARDLYQKGLDALERNNLDYAIEMLRGCLDLEPVLRNPHPVPGPHAPPRNSRDRTVNEPPRSVLRSRCS